MNFVTFGKPIKVVKKNEWGIIVLFSTSSKLAIDSPPDHKKPKLEDGEKILLCGVLCDEITCPFLNFDLRIEFKTGNLYKVITINSIVRDFKTLTPTVIRKTLKNTEYFGTGDYAKIAMKQELEDLLSLGCTFTFESKTQIDALIGHKHNELHGYLFKNIFRGAHYLKLLDIFKQRIKDISEEYLDLLETILIGQNLPPLDKLENFFLNVPIGDSLWETLCQTLDLDVADSHRIKSARRASQILSELKGPNPLPYLPISDLVIRKFLQSRPEFKVLQIESSHYVFLKENANAIAKVVSSLKSFPNLNLIQVEYDTDHDSQHGYFDWIRTQFKDKYDTFAILYTLDKRKYYLAKNTGLPVISLQDLRCRDKPLSHLLIDRCHVLNFSAFGKILSEIKTPETNVYLAGSLFCPPEKGNMNIALFSEVYASKLRATRMKMSGELPLDQKVKSYAPMISNITSALSPPYSIFTKTVTRKKQLSVKCRVFCNDEIRYSMPSQGQLIICLENTMNLHDIAKYLMCSTVKHQTVYIVGTRAKMLSLCKQRNDKTSLFSKMLD